MSKWERLVVATWNIGDGTHKDALRIMLQADVLLVQEASDQDDLLWFLHAQRYESVRPEVHPGQAAVACVYRPDVLRLNTRITKLMVPGQNVGKGTGPDHMKPKWMVGAFFTHIPSGRHLAITSTHRVAGNSHGPREQVATQHAQKIAAVFAHHNGPSIVGMDANSVATDNTLRPLRLAGWKSDQLKREIPTHGPKWAPDQIWWKEPRRLRSRIRFVSHFTTPTNSDHRALFAEFDIRRKK